MSEILSIGDVPEIRVITASLLKNNKEEQSKNWYWDRYLVMSEAVTGDLYIIRRQAFVSVPDHQVLTSWPKT